MKLPRYLQVALLATAVAVVWSYSDEDESSSVLHQAVRPVTHSSVKTVREPPPASRHERVDLFPAGEAEPLKEESIPMEQAPPIASAEPDTPALQLQVLGTWWSHDQRIIILTDGVGTWPVCRACKAAGKIWLGSEPVRGWKLTAVGKDHLLFEWQSNHAQRRLALKEIHTEPTQ